MCHQIEARIIASWLIGRYNHDAMILNLYHEQILGIDIKI